MSTPGLGAAGDTAQALRHLQDRAAIADLVHTYALNIRDGAGAACAELFADDAVFEMFDADPADLSPRLRARIEGREAIIAHIAGASRPGSRVCPMIHNLTIRIDGDAAEGACTMNAVTIPGGHELIGAYRDRFRCDGGVWHFTARAHTILLHRPSVAGGS
jgi:ketosteroid isomerase-like protein